MTPTEVILVAILVVTACVIGYVLYCLAEPRKPAKEPEQLQKRPTVEEIETLAKAARSPSRPEAPKKQTIERHTHRQPQYPSGSYTRPVQDETPDIITPALVIGMMDSEPEPERNYSSHRVDTSSSHSYHNDTSSSSRDYSDYSGSSSSSSYDSSSSSSSSSDSSW